MQVKCFFNKKYINFYFYSVIKILKIIIKKHNIIHSSFSSIDQ